MESILKLYRKQLFSLVSPRIFFVRTIKRRRMVRELKGTPPYLAKSLSQKLEVAAYKDPAIHFKVNIGLPQVVENRTSILQERTAHLKKLKKDPALEKKARDNQLSLNLDDVTNEWVEESAPQHIKTAAEHYNVFKDLFGDAFFYPQINLNVSFHHEDSYIPVFRGNCVKPMQALSAPVITYNSDPNTLWTLVASNPDGHLEQENSEYLHWFVGNIPSGELKAGELLADYVQPFPARGTGYQRLVFVIYKQIERINYSSLVLPSNKTDFKSRTFKTDDFYRAHQDKITPAGLAFCQVDWDDSVSHFFHTVMEMEEPSYQYDFAPPYHPKQKMFPLKQPFNLYMDRYRDPKQIAKEYLLKKLKNRHPFEKPKPPVRFPNVEPVRHDLDEKLYGRPPSWLKREKLKERLGYGRINDY